MSEHTHDGGQAPEGMHLHSSSEVAVMAITGALAARQGLMDTSELKEMFASFEKSIAANSPENNAIVLLSIANLAATAYGRLADLTDASPLDLMNADVAFDEAIIELGRDL